jgi:hypothetical protein
VPAQGALETSELAKNTGEISSMQFYTLAEYVNIIRVNKNEVIFAKGHEDTCTGILLEGEAMTKVNGLESR